MADDLCFNRNCGGEGDQEYEEYLGNGLVVEECPVSFIKPISNYYIELFWSCHHATTGYSSVNISLLALPEKGGMFDQDNKTMEVFELLRSEAGQILNKKADKDGG